MQGGSGLVQGIRFSNIQVSEVQTPIIIDQFYCDKTTCRNQTSAVAVSGVQYENIRGTFTIKPAHFACSDNSPCSDITLTGIQLKPVIVPQYHLYNPFCWQAFGVLYTPTVPPIACLQIGKPAGNSVLSDGDLCWKAEALWEGAEVLKCLNRDNTVCVHQTSVKAVVVILPTPLHNAVYCAYMQLLSGIRIWLPWHVPTRLLIGNIGSRWYSIDSVCPVFPVMYHASYEMLQGKT